jgi:hypothetical protein
LREKFEEKELMYVRNYIDGLDVSWQDFFHTTDKAEVENYCRQAGVEFEWLENNGLKTRKIRHSVMEEIGAIYQENQISFTWQKGDILMLDNMLTSHSRNPYAGSRKIVVAMGELMAGKDV